MIQTAGHGSRKRRYVDRYGFPSGKPFMKVKLGHGFQTGDIVKAVVPDVKMAGIHIGKVSVRSTGRFNIKINLREFSRLQAGDESRML